MLPTLSEIPFSTEWYRNWPRSNLHFPAAGQVSANALRADLVPLISLTCVGGLGTNEIAESVETIGAFVPAVGNRPDMLRHSPSGTAGFWDRPMIAHVRVLERQRDAGNATVRIGMELGTYNTGVANFPLPPFAALATRNVVQFWLDMAPVPQWWLQVNRVGAVRTTVALAGVTAPGTLNRPRRMTLAYNPGEYVAAYIDGVEGARITNPAQLPDTTNPDAWGLGIFALHQIAAVNIEGYFLQPTLLTLGIE